MHKQRVLFDVDGVLGDFHMAAQELIFELFSLEFSPDDFVTWDVTDVLKDQQQKDLCNAGIARPGFATSILPYQDAIEAMSEVRSVAEEKELEILFVTTPHPRSRTWMQERTEWLQKHFCAHHEEVMHVYRKHAVSGAVLVEDKPTNLDSWLSHWPGRHGILVDRVYNRNVSHLRRAHGWQEIIGLMRQL
jgi:5'(3')-deoxyribonucleotidase